MGFDVVIICMVLSIPVFILCRKVFCGISDKKTRTIVTWIATLITTPVVYGGIILLWIASIEYYPKRDFDKERWQKEVETRYEMTDDLVQNEVLIGKTKEEVIEFLGLEENSMESDLWSFYVGFRPRLFGIDPDVLELHFDAGKVVRCVVYET